MGKENRKGKKTEKEKSRDRKGQGQKGTEKRKGGKGFGGIWLSCWWPVLLVMVLFLIAGTSVVYRLQADMEEEQFYSIADDRRAELDQLQERYEQTEGYGSNSAWEDNIAALEANLNLPVLDDFGVFLCDSQGEIVFQREPSLYLYYTAQDGVNHYYRCGDKDTEQQILEAYGKWMDRREKTALRAVIRIDEAYLIGNECFPLRVNIYSMNAEEVQEGVGICYHLQETITIEYDFPIGDSGNSVYLTDLDLLEDGDSIGELGRKTSDARSAGKYYVTTMNVEEWMPELSQESKKAMLAYLLEDTSGMEAVAYYCFELQWEDNKTYHSVVMPVFYGSQPYYYILLKQEQRTVTTDAYVALGWVIGILFSAFIALVIAKGFARTMRKEQELICRQRDYTNALAHDLKTPLMAISGYAENLQSNVNPEKQEHYYEAIQSNVHYMNRLITDMLNLAGLQRAEETLSRENVDMRSMTEQAASYYEQELSEKKQQLKIVGSGYMNADSLLLERAIRNLIENAVKYSPVGEAIQIQLEDNSFRITNTGVTLPKEKWEEVFQPFVKGDPARERDSGIGLGLAIVRDIAQLHGFQCRLECTEQATTVVLCAE